jgi:hypothetical protein
MRPLTSMLVVVVTMLLASAPADASTVELQPVNFCVNGSGDCRYMNYQAGVVLRYDGELGEPNRVLVRRDGGALLVGDGGAILRPASGCVATDAHTARCELASTPLVGYRLDGNDGDDVIAIDGALTPSTAVAEPRLLLGGSGADDLIDGADASTLAGGPGADSLSGGGGDDRFLGFDFADAAEAAERDDAADDVVDGGAGTDIADYQARRQDLALTLSGTDPGGGEAGEHDRLQHVEVILGGRGDDHISGGPGADRLEGNGGADLLRGHGGDDVLIGGLGADDLRGGGGDDRVGTGGGPRDGADRARCGPGRDLVGELLRDDFLGDSWSGPDTADVVGADCEGVPFVSELDLDRDVRLDARPHRRGRLWTFANPCAHAHLRRCHGRLDLALAGKRPFARIPFSTAGLVSVWLTPTQSRRIAHTRRVAVRVTAQQGRSNPAPRQAAFTLSLPPAPL